MQWRIANREKDLRLIWSAANPIRYSLFAIRYSQFSAAFCSTRLMKFRMILGNVPVSSNGAWPWPSTVTAWQSG